MGKPDRPELLESILKIGDKLFRQLLPAIPREGLLELDVTMPQLKIMLLLFINGPMRMGALAADLQVTLATATGLVERLVEREMVTRESQPDDRRVVLCRLSQEGQKTISRIWETARHNTRVLLENLDTGTLQTLAGVLQTMLNAGGAAGGKADSN
jgi:DNA-binding MarR family transcriptional regulator